MATFAGKSVNNTFKNLLNIDNNNQGIDNTLRPVQDGEGTESALQLSTSEVNVDGTFKIDGYSIQRVGDYNVTFTVTGDTTVTFPENGTLVSSDSTSFPSLEEVGTINTGTWNADIISPAFGGTGVNNGSFTTTLGGNFSTIGAFNTTVTVTGDTNITLPTTGTVSTLDGTESLSNKTLVAPALGTPSSGTLTNCSGLPPTGLSAPVPLTKGGSGYANLQTLVQRKSVHILTTNGTAQIARDNTIPQISEGGQIATLSITPLNSSNILVFKCGTPCSILGPGGTIVLALFNAANTDAIAVQDAYVAVSNAHTRLDIHYEAVAGTTSPLTFTIRMGSNAGTWYTTDNGAGNYGGVLQANAFFEILEYTP